MPDSDPQPDPLSPPEPGAGLFVLLVWSLLTITALGLTWRHAPVVLRWDDYELVPAFARTEPITVEGLWRLHNEHRLPLPRVLMIASFRLWGDLRPIMLASALAMSVVAAVLLLALRRARPHSSYADAALPLLLLHPGHAVNWAWAIQIAFVLPTVLGALAIAAALWRPGRPGFLAVLAFGLAALLLPLCSATGLAYAPAMALGLVAIGLREWRSSAAERALAPALLALVLSAATFALVALYFRNYQGSAHHEGGRTLPQVAITAAQFLAMGWGPVGRLLWPWSGLLAVLVSLAAIASLLRGVLSRSHQRPGALGLIAVAAGFACLVLGTAWGRAGLGDQAGLQERYVSFAVPALAFSLVPLSLFGSRFSRRFAPMALFLLSAILFWPNSLEGLSEFQRVDRGVAAFLADARSGAPRFVAVRHGVPFLHPSQDELARAIETLSAAGFEPYRSIRPDPPFLEIPISAEPSQARMARWDSGTITLEGPDPELTFDLPAPTFVAAVRLDYDHSAAEGGPAHFRLSWRSPGRAEPAEGQSHSVWALPTGSGRSITVRIAEPIDQLRLQPDTRPGTFRLRAFDLLVPPPG